MNKIFYQAICRFIPFFMIALQASCASMPVEAMRPALPGAVEKGFAQEKAPEIKPEVLPTAPQEQSGLANAANQQVPSGEDAVKEPRFNISAKKISARNFFLYLVESSDTNIVVHPKVEGEISISLKDVTIPEVMEVMRDVYGYEYRRTRSGYQVLPGGGIQSRTYQIDYLNLNRKGMSKTRVSSGQVSRSGGSENSDGQVKSSESVSGSVIDTESSSDFWKELEKALKEIVGTDTGRQVVVLPQGNLIIIRALPRELSEVETYLKILQGNLIRQVIIEAKIIEVALNDGFQSGINWSTLLNVDSGTVSLTQTGGGTLINQGISEIARETGVLDPSNPQALASTLTSAFGGAFAASLQFTDFSAFIELLQTQGDVQVLSSPRISTMNNQKAVIKVGDDEYFVTDISSDTVTGTSSSTSNDITLTPFFSGIALDVTPQIDSAGIVTLHIHPTVSEVIDQQKVVTVGGGGADGKPSQMSLPLAFSSIRESDSIVRAASGQVVVIGGLMKNNNSRNVAGVPVLGKIPWLGALFRHTKTESIKSELVILVRPIVVQDDAGWDMLHQNSRERLYLLRDNAEFGWQGD
ncbi:MAG: pilus (MSHA type) biogenesis protein MshL [Syntrophobacterales bacterium]|nr:MAG: pilus (MSHA type) biogenesis protein MshL [Syntrophobacterales bacterium]